MQMNLDTQDPRPQTASFEPRQTDWQTETFAEMEMGWLSWLCNYGSNFLINCDSDWKYKSASATEFAF